METLSASDFKKKYGDKGITRFSVSEFDKKQGKGYTLGDAGGDIKETFLNMGKSAFKTGEDLVTRDIRKPDENIAERVVGYGADIFKGIGRTVGDAFTGAAKLAVPQSVEDATVDVVEAAGETIAGWPVTKDIVASYNALDPDTKAQVENVLGYLEGIGGLVGGTKGNEIVGNIIKKAGSGAIKGATATGEAFGAAAITTGDAIASIPRPRLPSFGGAGQMVQEAAERVPRAIDKVKQATDDAALRAERIEAGTPAVKTAIKSGVDERIINTVAQADEATVKAYKEILDIAEKPQSTIRPKEQPSIVAGKAAEATYDVLEKERKRIGTELGDEIKKLPKTVSIDMRPAYAELENTLAKVNVYPVLTEKGFKLDFTKSKLTEKQRTVVRDLFRKATEGGQALSPLQVKEKDQLFSSIQREARTDQIQDVLIDLPDGNKKNLFESFRDVYSNQLENINPRIRELNREYRNSKVLIDNLEDTIFKSGKYESIVGVDQAEFAKVNLRRIMGEAQSTPTYQAILDKMDARARELGYTGARADDLTYFAEELRKLYPDSIPKAGFQGGIRTGVRDIAERLMSTGAPDITDQQKALRELIEEALTKLGGQAQTTPSIPAKGSAIKSPVDLREGASSQ